ncbi:BLUF domain-containing protein [Aquimarina sp. 2201CG1-2-11]|uniref:BLUF domain-containing protein n=1 Tax=Aquimarina discodermiae TaxID=3231043 RepID=UPI003462AF9E
MRYAISYVSTVNPTLSNSDITKLMDYVNTYNNAKGIIGILIYSDGNFFQVLEGSKSVIQEMFEKIKKDTRHHNIIKMLDQEIEGPPFSEYHSSYTVLSDHHNQCEIQRFLKNEAGNKPAHFKSTSYLAKKILKVT